MPAFAISTRRRFRPTRSLATRVLRIALVLSLWHAPIPWVHAHEIGGPQVDRLQFLARHVSEFHSHEVAHGDQRLDWHLHLILPWCLVHHLPCPDEDQRAPGSDEYFGGAPSKVAGMTLSQEIGQPTARAFLAGDLAADQAAMTPQETGPQAAIFGGARGTHFFETDGRTNSVRNRLGVRLC